MESNTRGKQKGIKGKLERTAWFLGKIYMFRSKCTLVRVKIHKVPGDKMETSLQRLMSELIIILREGEGWIRCGVHGTPQLFTGLDSALKLVTSYLEATVTMLGVVRAWPSKRTKKERERKEIASYLVKDLCWLRASFLFSLLEIPLVISTSTTWPTTCTRKIGLYGSLQIWFKKLFSFNRNIYM